MLRTVKFISQAGARNSKDKYTCVLNFLDIDECQRNPCRNIDDICFNTRGSYKCHTIKCPPNYIKDPDHRRYVIFPISVLSNNDFNFSRCKRASNICDIRDLNCINQPEQYSYHFVTFVSQLPIPEEGRIDFFQMKGPAWIKSNTNFNMDIVDVRCPHSVPKADKSYFRTKREANKVTLSVVRPIQGPQEIEIQLQMELYINSVFHGKVVSTIFIFVSEYTF